MPVKNIKDQIRNIKVAIGTMESNNKLSRANRIILELGLETLEGLVQEISDKLRTYE